MNLIDGKKIAAELRNELKVEVDGIKKKFNKVPGLTVILIGDLAPSQIYVRNKEKSAKEIGLKSEIIKYPKDIQEISVLNKIDELNNDETVSGILVQLPLSSLVRPGPWCRRRLVCNRRGRLNGGADHYVQYTHLSADRDDKVPGLMTPFFREAPLT